MDCALTCRLHCKAINNGNNCGNWEHDYSPANKGYSNGYLLMKKKYKEKKINCYISIPSLEQWLIKLQGSLINTPAFLELPSDMMKCGSLVFKEWKKEPFRTDGAEWRGHRWIIARECQIMLHKHVWLIFQFLEFLDRVLEVVQSLESPSQHRCWQASHHPHQLPPPASVSLGPPAPASRCQGHAVTADGLGPPWCSHRSPPGSPKMGGKLPQMKRLMYRTYPVEPSWLDPVSERRTGHPPQRRTERPMKVKAHLAAS